MKTEIKTPDDSETIMTEVVFPNDTNPMGIIQGGRIIQLMDIACAVCAQSHAGKIAVTASIDKVTFKQPAIKGDILTIKARITRVFKSSMEIYVEVTAKRLPEMKAFQTNIAYFTFVAIDEHARPTSVPGLKPLTKDDKDHYKAALKRRVQRIN